MDWFFLVSVVVFAFVPSGYAASIMPQSGMTTKWSCKTGIHKEKSVSYFNSGANELIFFDRVDFDSKESDEGEPKEKIWPARGMFQDWGYILGFPQISVRPDLLRTVSLKSGDLGKLVSLKAGTYQGVLDFDQGDGSFPVKAKVKLGEARTEKTALGNMKALPIDVQVSNFDGKGGELEMSSLYSPSLRMHFQGKMKTLPRPGKRDYECELASIKQSQRSVSESSFKLELPGVGTKLAYKCEGKIKAGEFDIIKKEGSLVRVKWTSEGEKVDSIGTVGMFYFGLANKKSGGTLPDRDFQVRLDRPFDFEKEMKPSILTGQLDVSHGKDLVATYRAVFSVDPIVDYNEEPFGKQRVIPLRKFLYKEGNYRAYRVNYSPSLKVPMNFEYIQGQVGKNNGLFGYACRLFSISKPK